MTQLVKHLPFEYQDLSVVSRTCQNKNKNQTGKAWGPCTSNPRAGEAVTGFLGFAGQPI